MLFKEIVGHGKIKEKLIQTVKDGRISHAQLFLGPEGCGNLPMAIAYATYISCSNRGDTDSCGTCPSCLKYGKFIHPDLHFVFPVNTGKLVSKDATSNDYISYWRDFLLKNIYFHESQWYEFIGIENKQGLIGSDESQQIIRKLSLKPYESDYKIMILWLPEKMNPSAANKLLKLIEEPSENTVILMVSESAEQILPTILSRVQLVKFKGVDDEDLKNAIEGKNPENGNELENLIHLANGNYLALLDLIHPDEDAGNQLELFSELTRTAYSNKIARMLEITDDLASLGREKQKRFLDYSLRMFRENSALRLNQNQLVYLDEKEMDFSRKFSAFINTKNIFRITELFSKAMSDVESNGNARIIFLDLMLKLHVLIHPNGK